MMRCGLLCCALSCGTATAENRDGSADAAADTTVENDAESVSDAGSSDSGLSCEAGFHVGDAGCEKNDPMSTAPCLDSGNVMFIEAMGAGLVLTGSQTIGNKGSFGGSLQAGGMVVMMGVQPPNWMQGDPSWSFVFSTD